MRLLEHAFSEGFGCFASLLNKVLHGAHFLFLSSCSQKVVIVIALFMLHPLAIKEGVVRGLIELVLLGIVS